MTNKQERFWKYLTQFHFQLLYLEMQLERQVKIHRGIQIAAAGMSATSIAAWATWQNLAFLWGFIIAVSQVVIAINAILPYHNRISEISGLLSKQRSTYIEMERDLYKVMEKNMSEEEINQLCYEYVQKWAETEKDCLKDDVLPRSDKIKTKAETANNHYFEMLQGEQDEER